MNLKSFFKRLFFGDEVLEKVDSPVNGEITVTENLFGGREMKIGGLTQSGGLVEKVWKVALSKVQSSRQMGGQAPFKVQSCLILGLGCGNAAKLISKQWPGAKITGVEIDPEVIKIGKKYFGLEKISNLETKIEDAFDFCYSLSVADGKQRYDLIIVDLYLGQEFPKEAESEEFLIILKKVLENNGLIIFNRLYFNKSHQELTECFLLKIKKIFLKIKTKKVFTNLLILCEK